MSRVGRLPITVPAGVSVAVSEANVVTVKGPKGTLTLDVKPVITVKVEGTTIVVDRVNEEKHTKQLHGTTRANIQNMVTGVSEGFKIDLAMFGVGYKAEVKGTNLVLNVGFSHPVTMAIPAGIAVEVIPNKKDPNRSNIIVSGHNKQVVGQFAALVREKKQPEPYKGKGIAYSTEHIRRKEGKKASKK